MEVKKPCNKEKLDYEKCLLHWGTRNEGLCRPEKIWYEICENLENLREESSKVNTTVNKKDNARSLGNSVSQTPSSP